MSHDRACRAERLLADAGIPGRVTEAGLEGEVAAVTAALASLPTLRRLAPQIRALGFRAVALELESTEADSNHGSI